VPVFATAVWIGGASYYYADDVYYAPVPGGYAVVQPPGTQQVITEEPATTDAGAATSGSDVTEQPANTTAPTNTGASVKAPSEGVYIYPSQGQNAQQQQTDRSECRTWAVGQT